MALMNIRVSLMRGAVPLAPVLMQLATGSVVESLQDMLADERFGTTKKDPQLPTSAYAIKAEKGGGAPLLTPNTVLVPDATYYVFVNRKGEKKELAAGDKAPGDTEQQEAVAKRPRTGRTASTYEWMAEGTPLRDADQLAQAKKQMHSWETQMSTARKSNNTERLDELSKLHKSIGMKVKDYLAANGRDVAAHHESTGVKHTCKVLNALNTIATAVVRREKESQDVVQTLAEHASGSGDGTPTAMVPTTPSQVSQQGMVVSPQLYQDFMMFMAFKDAQAKQQLKDE
jgi:hypothetical protein